MNIDKYKSITDQIKYELVDDVPLTEAINFLTKKKDQLIDMGVDPETAKISYYLDESDAYGTYLHVTLEYRIPKTQREIEDEEKRIVAWAEDRRKAKLETYYALKKELGL